MEGGPIDASWRTVDDIDVPGRMPRDQKKDADIDSGGQGGATKTGGRAGVLIWM